MYLTNKQLELMRVVIAKNEDGSPTDLDQIIDRINYATTKQSIQFTVRSLVKHGLIEKVGVEKRRDRQRVLIVSTDLGCQFAGPRRSGSIVSTVEEDEFLEDMETIIV